MITVTKHTEGQQRQDARRLLQLIMTEGYGGHLTYRDLALRFRGSSPEKYGRAMAAVCDLLDAAACIGGAPALALIAVRSQDGEINPKAWKELGTHKRDAIISRSLNHVFVASDFENISRGLDLLAPRGRKSAWEYIKETVYPRDLLYRRMLGDYSDPSLNAIDDIGTDQPTRVLASTYVYLRDERVRDRVLKRANGICEHCGIEGFLKQDGTRYLESHHVIALADQGED